jgi:anti-anti-sigma factor|tara:strand:- start:72 stop:413 length:342 start_codon:yes stop_codon:yes gene_type:complete
MDFSLTTRNEGDVVIIETNGYLNNVGGEQIAQACYKEIDNGKKLFLINLENSKVVNSIGVSILIEIIEKLQDVDGKLGYYNLAPIVEKTFNIMGLTKYSSVFSSESEALQGMS